MAAELFVLPARATDANGNPFSGAKLYFYASGTLTPQAVYTTDDLTTPHTNPVIADSGGMFPAIYYEPAMLYRGVCKNASESVTLFDLDPINNSVLSQFTQDGGAALIGTANGSNVQAELDNKADSRPSPALNSLTTTTEAAYEDFLLLWWDSVNNHLYHTDGSGSTLNGRVDITKPKPAAWHMWSAVAVIYEHWKHTGSASDITKITQQWTYIKTMWTATQLRTDVSANGISNISDDSAWHAKGMRMVHEMTGSSDALAYLMDFIPAALERYKDPLQTQVSYGASPTGVLFKACPWGILYAESTDAASIGLYGYASSVFEAILADQALYVFRVDATKTNYRNYAAATYNWIYANLRRDGSTASAAGIYLTALNLDPDVANPTSAVVDRGGGGPFSAQDTNQVYHQGQNAFFGAPIRGLGAEYDGGTAAMGTLALNLYASTGTSAYLTEANAICLGYPATNGFGRVYRGIPVLGQIREGWTTGFSLAEFCRLAFVNVAVDTTNAMRIAVRNTGKSILAQADSHGRLSADWAGPEYNFLTGNHTWSQESADGYGAARGGGIANPLQIMTHSSSMGTLLAARYAVSPTIALGSGAVAKPSIEDMQVDIAMLSLALRAKADRAFATFDGSVGLSKDFGLFENAAGEYYLALGSGALIAFDPGSTRVYLMNGAQVVDSFDGNGTLRSISGVVAAAADPLA